MSEVRPTPSQDIARLLGHTTIVLILMTALYFVLPLRFRLEGGVLARLAISVVALAALGLLLRLHLRRARPLSPPYSRIEWLLAALYSLVLAFALTYFAIATFAPGQFVGLSDRTDALYFSVTVMATVGFGDIHAQGTLAKLVVTVHMIVNLIYIGTALRLLTTGRPPTE
jgi:voltage-gated potassium channel